MTEELQRKINVLERALTWAANSGGCSACPIRRRCDNTLGGLICDELPAHYIKKAEETINED